MVNQWLRNLLANSHQWIQRREWVLEHHADVLAAKLRQFGICALQQFLAVEQNASAHCCAFRQKTHDRKHAQALAGTRFADDAQLLARLNRK